MRPQLCIGVLLAGRETLSLTGRGERNFYVDTSAHNLVSLPGTSLDSDRQRYPSFDLHV
jgi:hypothetical protein